MIKSWKRLGKDLARDDSTVVEGPLGGDPVKPVWVWAEESSVSKML